MIWSHMESKSFENQDRIETSKHLIKGNQIKDISNLVILLLRSKIKARVSWPNIRNSLLKVKGKRLSPSYILVPSDESSRSWTTYSIYQGCCETDIGIFCRFNSLLWPLSNLKVHYSLHHTTLFIAQSSWLCISIYGVLFSFILLFH